MYELWIIATNNMVVGQRYDHKKKHTHTQKKSRAEKYYYLWQHRTRMTIWTVKKKSINFASEWIRPDVPGGKYNKLRTVRFHYRVYAEMKHALGRLSIIIFINTARRGPAFVA